jgi:hypothetical protein
MCFCESTWRLTLSGPLILKHKLAALALQVKGTSLNPGPLKNTWILGLNCAGSIRAHTVPFRWFFGLLLSRDNTLSASKRLDSTASHSRNAGFDLSPGRRGCDFLGCVAAFLPNQATTKLPRRPSKESLKCFLRRHPQQAIRGTSSSSS